MNVEMPIIDGILTFISMINSMPSLVEHGKRICSQKVFYHGHMFYISFVMKLCVLSCLAMIYFCLCCLAERLGAFVLVK